MLRGKVLLLPPQGGRARHDFSLAWIDIIGGLARLIGCGFKKGCVLPITLLLNREHPYCLLERGRSSRDVLYRPCHLGVSFFEGVLVLRSCGGEY